MRRARAVIIMIFLAVTAVAEQHPNQKKGFNANDVYQLNGFDAVNVFNGNLTLSLPLGASYSVGGGLSYRFVLYANANVWEGESGCAVGQICPNVCGRRDKNDCEVMVQPMIMHPHRRANAGMGWTLSLGRLYDPDHPAMAEHTRWTYESPDGADHPFDGTEESGVTTDGTFLRMTKVSETLRKIEFPNGEIHEFGPPVEINGSWVLTKITNQYALNYVTISYVNTAGGGLQWRVSDSYGRLHLIQFEQLPYAGALKLMVSKVTLAVFGNTTADIDFTYKPSTLDRGVHHTATSTVPTTVGVQLLERVELPDHTPDVPHDEMAYVFQYVEGSMLDPNGVPRYVTLPLGGAIEWVWGTYYKPEGSAAAGEEYLRQSHGVVQRRTFKRPASATAAAQMEGTREYAPSPDCSPEYEATKDIPCREFTNTIKEPDNTRSKHYFSVSTDLDGFWLPYEYGQPFTKKAHDGTSPGRWLSTETYRVGETTPFRSTYVRFDHTMLKNWRPVSTRTIFHDDLLAVGNETVKAYIDRESEDWDGYGHYGTVTVSGNLPGIAKRVTRTAYKPPSASSYVTGLYDSVTVEEGGKSYRTEFDFAANGFLEKKRLIAAAGVTEPPAPQAPARGVKDLVVIYHKDARGNVIEEGYHGGDARTATDAASSDVPTGPLDGLSLGVPVYSIEYVHPDPMNGVFGTAVSYPSLNVVLSSGEIDRNSGLVRVASDGSGLQTEYTYDWAGRVLWEKPQRFAVPGQDDRGRAWTKYEYATLNNFRIAVTQYPSFQPTGTPLTHSRYDLDGFGRVVTEYVKMPKGSESRRETTYDAAGRISAVSELGTAAVLPKTTTTYDTAGRPYETTRPDGSVTTLVYTGERVVERRFTIFTGTPQQVSVFEERDMLGRLHAVTESSGPTSASNPTGAAVRTEYSYDFADRLSLVRMRAAGNSAQQERVFSYDGRGFLKWELHPESGIATYTYDARGHVLTKLQSGARSQFDLRYEYDSAERLLNLRDRNPRYIVGGTEPEFRLLKEFTFGTVNDASTPNFTKGKVATATRYNYSPDSTVVYKVQDAFKYADIVGRMTDRQTTISLLGPTFGPAAVPMKVVSIAVKYDDLDQQKSLSYPMCVNCGTPDTAPAKNLQINRDAGRITSIPGHVTDITYWPNGMRNALVHKNSLADTQVVGTMPRPHSISTGVYRHCIGPRFVQEPRGIGVSGGATVTLQAVVDGTPGMKYQWSRQYPGSAIVVLENETAATITFQATGTAKYRVLVSNSCGYIESQDALVEVDGCSNPTTGPLRARVQADGSFILEADAGAREVGLAFAWRKVGDATVLGTTESLAVPAPTVTTTYSFTVTDQCGTATSNVTLTVSAKMSATGLVATKTGTSQITVTWPRVSGSPTYSVERRSGSAGWVEVAEVVGDATQEPIFIDNTVTTNKTYAYRVVLNESQTNTDVATTTTFVAAGGDVSDVAFAEMLRAVNMVRDAAAWPALTWANILAPNDPLPVPGAVILKQHITAARARMDEALHALGVRTSPYADAVLDGLFVQAKHINDVQERAK